MGKCRKAADGLKVRLYERATGIPDAWNALLPEDHFLRTTTLGIYEQMHLPDVNYHYALLESGGVAKAVVYFQVLAIRSYHLNEARLTPFRKKAWQAFTAGLCPRLLVAGHLFRHDICSFYWSEDVPPFRAYQLYQEAIKAVMRKSGAHAVLVKDLAEALIPYFQHYAPRYLLLRNDISMSMPVPGHWAGIADYEKSLKHKYAQRFRKIRQHWDGLEIQELDAEAMHRNADVVFRLYEQVSERQPVRLGKLSAQFLPALKAAHPEQLRVWLLREQNVPVAFFSAWDRGTVFDMFYIGFDYSRNESLQLYFNILFFSVEQAIASGKETLVLGRTALEAKARLGCTPKYLSTFLFIRNPFVRRIMLQLQQQITDGEGEWENRHPFKK